MREKTASERLLQTLDQQTITTPMCQILDLEDGELLQWQVQEISETNGAATGGVYRLTGTGRGQDREMDWSLILKVLCRTPAGKAPGGLEQEHVLYWKREALVYQSGLLNDLPGGLRGPPCYAVTVQDDESVWLWLEDDTAGESSQAAS